MIWPASIFPQISVRLPCSTPGRPARPMVRVLDRFQPRPAPLLHRTWANTGIFEEGWNRPMALEPPPTQGDQRVSAVAILRPDTGHGLHGQSRIGKRAPVGVWDARPATAAIV